MGSPGQVVNPALVQATAGTANKSGAMRSGSFTPKVVTPRSLSRCSSLSSPAVHPMDRRHHRLHLRCRPGRDGVRLRTRHRRPPDLQGNTIHERARSIKRPRPPLPGYSSNSGIWSRWTSQRPTASRTGPSAGNSLRPNCSPIWTPATTSGPADGLGTPTNSQPSLVPIGVLSLHLGWHPDTLSTRIGVYNATVSNHRPGGRSEARSRMRRRPTSGSCLSMSEPARRT